MTQVFHALGFFYVYLLEKWNTKMSDKKLLREYYELCPNGICKDYLTESDKRRIREEGVVYLTGVIQRADAKNGNGRIYPRKVLEREVEKYKQIINENRALGELDHPECVSSGEVLTVEGWKEFVDLKEGEEIFTLSLSGDLEVQKITKRIEKSYKGKMIRIKGRNIDCEVTPNHRFLIVNRKNEYKYVTAKEILEDSIPDMNKCYIPKAIKNKKIEQNKTIKIKGITRERNGIPYEKYEKWKQELEVNAELFCSFLGFYLAEGFCQGSQNVELVEGNLKVKKGAKCCQNSFVLCQKKKENLPKIESLLENLKFDYKMYSRDDGMKYYVISDARVYKFLHKLGKAKDKYIPREIKKLPANCLEKLLEWYHIGDGRTRSYNNQKSIFSTSEKLMKDFQEILLKVGKSGNITIDKRTEKDRKIIENGTVRWIKAENSNDIYNLNISNTKGIYLDKRHLVVEEFDYDGMVYCVNVPNSNFYLKQNGKVHWSGNSNTISLSNVSHIVESVWWDGNDLMGKIRVLKYHPKGKILEGLIKDGVQIGISSRAIGSIREEGDAIIVEDDLSLVGFDMVQCPSTHNAFMIKEYKEHKPRKKTKIDKLSYHLIDILK